MKYLIISFKSRNNVMTFAKIMQKNGLYTSVINTPRSVSISCGLSIRTEFHNLQSVITLLRKSNLSGLIGVYSITRKGTHEEVEKFY